MVKVSDDHSAALGDTNVGINQVTFTITNAKALEHYHRLFSGNVKTFTRNFSTLPGIRFIIKFREQ